jgi:hypothetical protein
MRQYQEKVLPYEALESLGINRGNLKTSDTDALLSGHKTDLMKFSVEDTPERRHVLEREKAMYIVDENGKLNFEGKIQLQKYMIVDDIGEHKNILKNANIEFEELKGNKLRFDANAMQKFAIGAAVLISPVTALALMLVLKKREITNSLGLKDSDIRALKQGDVVRRINDKKENVLVQLDKDTNNLVSVRAKDISIPNRVAGQDLTPIQKEMLKNGQEIKITDRRGDSVIAKIDLNEKSGLSLKDETGRKITVPLGQKKTQEEEQKQKREDGLTTDRSKLDFIAANGYQGIKNHPESNKVFDNAFMEKYGLKEDYRNALKAHNNYHSKGTNRDSLEFGRNEMYYNDKLKQTANNAAYVHEKEDNKRERARAGGMKSHFNDKVAPSNAVSEHRKSYGVKI